MVEGRKLTEVTVALVLIVDIAQEALNRDIASGAFELINAREIAVI